MTLPYENTKTGTYRRELNNSDTISVTLNEINLNNLPVVEVAITKSNSYYYNPEPFGEDNFGRTGLFPVASVTFSNNNKTAVIDFGLGADEPARITANTGVNLRDHISVGSYLYFNNGYVHDVSFYPEENGNYERYSNWEVNGSTAEIYDEETGEVVVTFNNTNKQLTINVTAIMDKDYELAQCDYDLTYTISEKGSEEPDPAFFFGKFDILNKRSHSAHHLAPGQAQKQTVAGEGSQLCIRGDFGIAVDKVIAQQAVGTVIFLDLCPAAAVHGVTHGIAHGHSQQASPI